MDLTAIAEQETDLERVQVMCKIAEIDIDILKLQLAIKKHQAARKAQKDALKKLGTSDKISKLVIRPADPRPIFESGFGNYMFTPAWSTPVSGYGFTPASSQNVRFIESTKSAFGGR